jgi:acyl-CoA thioester hydrolase
VYCTLQKTPITPPHKNKTGAYFFKKKQMIYQFQVQVYYEDTDHSGVVYHANYLKYFERAREEMLGVTELVELWSKEKIGFVVYKANLSYRKGAQFGDRLTIQSSVQRESAYRLCFQQNAYVNMEQPPYVEADIQLACVHQTKGLVPLPDLVLSRLI